MSDRTKLLEAIERPMVGTVGWLDWQANLRTLAARMRAEPDPDVELARTMAESNGLLKQYAEECGPCDHAANVCVCGIKDQVQRNEELLEKLGVESV